MKKLLLILLCLPMIGFGQTLIPDANFEQALINLGYDTGTPNGSVPTTNINTVTTLDVAAQNISDLTGIEDFSALIVLSCQVNQLTSLDVSNNTALTSLVCWNNQLTSLDVSSNTALTDLKCYSNQLTNLDVSGTTALTDLVCYENQLTSIDVSSNTALTDLVCYENQLTILDVSGATALIELHCWNNHLTSLDVSANTALTTLHCQVNQLTSIDVTQNTALTSFFCENNQLISLDLRNGNNQNISSFFNCVINPNLTCISVDDAAWSVANWTVANGNIDSQHYFSNSCPPPSAIQEHTTNKELLKVTDLLGRETKQTNQPLFYIYDDGTVEKRIVIE